MTTINIHEVRRNTRHGSTGPNVTTFDIPDNEKVIAFDIDREDLRMYVLTITRRPKLRPVGEPVAAFPEPDEVDERIGIRRATDEERAKVEIIHVKAWGGPVSQSAVTGVPMYQDEDALVINLFSAGCVHGEYRVPLADIINREADPR